MQAPGRARAPGLTNSPADPAQCAPTRKRQTASLLHFARGRQTKAVANCDHVSDTRCCHSLRDYLPIRGALRARHPRTQRRVAQPLLAVRLCFLSLMSEIENRTALAHNGLPVRARPSPQFRFLHQTCLHRILLDIQPNFLKLPFIPNPMVKRFVLPKCSSCPPKESVRAPSRHALDSVGNPPQRRQRFDQNMHVVRHHNVGAQNVLTQLTPPKNCPFNTPRDFRIAEPARPRRTRIQLPVGCQESPSRPFLDFLKPPARSRWQRSAQSPRQKDGAPLGLPMRQSARVITRRRSILRL